MGNILKAQISNRIAQPKQPYRVATIVAITEKNEAIVDYPGNETGPIKARSVLNYAVHPAAQFEGKEVLLAFENDDLNLPIIIGAMNPEYSLLLSDKKIEASLDDLKLVFDAKEEIVLRCGKSSITLRRDGKVIIKGSDIVSRSSGSNKIKGASISLN